MAKYTSKLNLKKPEANDFYNVEDSNGNFDKIDEFASRTDNPHSVTKAQVGLGNVDNTSDMNKPVSTAQATAIAEAKSAGTNAQANINGHISNKSNPHNVTLEQIGAMSSNGGTFTGDLVIKKQWANLTFKDNNARIAYLEKNPTNNDFGMYSCFNDDNISAIIVKPETTALKECVVFKTIIESAETEYKIWGEHNLPYPSQIQNGSYDGNGGTGSKNSVILTFNFNPKIVFITGGNRMLTLVLPNAKGVGCGVNTATGFGVEVSWGEKSVSYYNGSNATDMMNASSTTYNWVAIG